MIFPASKKHGHCRSHESEEKCQFAPRLCYSISILEIAFLSLQTQKLKVLTFIIKIFSPHCLQRFRQFFSFKIDPYNSFSRNSYDSFSRNEKADLLLGFLLFHRSLINPKLPINRFQSEMGALTVALSFILACSSSSVAWSKSCRLLCETRDAYSIIGDISCQCDPLCEQMEDCCSDFWQECSQNRSADFKSIEGPVLGSVSCEPLSTVKPKPQGLVGVNMISSCSPNFVPVTEKDSSIQKNCMQGTLFREHYSLEGGRFYLITPVVTQNITYVNHYCALCNYASDEKFNWELIYTDFAQQGHDMTSFSTFWDSPFTIAYTVTNRYPPREQANLFSVRGHSRISKLCFVSRLIKNGFSETCTPLACPRHFKAYCYETNENILTNDPESCRVDFTGGWLLQPIPKNNHNMDFRIIPKRDSIFARIIDNYAEEERAFSEEINCSSMIEPDRTTCWLPHFDYCREIPCGLTMANLTENKTVAENTTVTETENQTKSKSWKGTKILAVTCLIISLLSMFLTAIVFVKTEALQTKILHLQIHCFVAHFAAIFSSISAGFALFRQTADMACEIIAIFLHLSFLTVFSWMNVIAWSLFMMILGQRRFLAELVVQSPKWVESLSHYALGWAAPVVIVLCSIGLENLESLESRKSGVLGSWTMAKMNFVGSTEERAWSTCFG